MGPFRCRLRDDGVYFPIARRLQLVGKFSYPADNLEGSQLSAERIQPVMFMSKLLSAAETRQLSTELEVACLGWTCGKLRLMIQSSSQTIVVLTDHVATKGADHIIYSHSDFFFGIAEFESRW
jgi:hypothetical protein